MKVLKISAVAMVLGLLTFAANAKDHKAAVAGFSCDQCKVDTCGKSAEVNFLKACADCPGLEVVDCGVTSFDAENCQKTKGHEFSKKCHAAVKMMAKGVFQAHLYAEKDNADAKAVMEGFKKLDEANLPEAQDTTE